jgi:hypothetical protein
MATEPDWSDPCAVAEHLRAAYYRKVSGSQESQVSYIANGVQRTVMYSQADMKELIGALRDAEAECAAKQGVAKPRRRFAIQGGSRGY